MAIEHQRDGYTISDDPARLQLDAIHGFLTRSYWSNGIDKSTVARSIENVHCFGIYADGAIERSGESATQVGGASVLTDYATFAYVMDVFVLEEHRGRGLSVWLMETIVAHPQLRDIPRWRLATQDAHGLYEKVGFGPLAHPERMMERIDPRWPLGTVASKP